MTPRFEGGDGPKDGSNANADAERERDRTEGHEWLDGGECGDAPADETAEDEASEGADEPDKDGFGEELAEDVLALGADSTTNPDFDTALVDGHEHDGHDADAAHEESDGGEPDDEGAENAHHLIDELEEVLLGEDGELLIVEAFVEGAFEGGDEVFGVGGRISLDHEAVDLDVGGDGFEVVVGEVGDVLEALGAEDGLAGLLVGEDADDGVGALVDFDGFAEGGGGIGEEAIFGDAAEDDAVLGGIFGGEEAAFGEFGIVHFEPVGGGSDDEGEGFVFAAADTAAGEGEEGDAADARDFAESFGVLLFEIALAAEVWVEAHAGVDFSGDDDEDVCAEVVDLFGDVFLDTEADADEKEDGDAGDGDADHGEEGGFPLVAEGLNRGTEGHGL